MKKQTDQFATLSRVSWIDICRGLGILLVLYGHLLPGDSQRYLIYSFHMPLFFFLSGLVFKPVFDKPLRWIIIKNFKQLLLPYFAFAISTYLFALLTDPGRDLSPGGIAWQLFGIVYGSGTNGMLGFNVVLWFLPCLFITKLTFAVITRRVTQMRLLGIILVLSGIVGYGVSVFLPWIKLPFGFEIAFTSIVFFGLGYLWKTRNFSYGVLKPYCVPLAIVGLFVTYYAATANYHIDGYQTDLRTNRFGDFFLFYSAALSGIFSWVMLSQLISKNKLLEYIGKNSMVIFAWHYLLFVNLKVILNTIASDDFINSVKLILPTFYVISAMTIILLSRKMLLLAKGAYRALPFYQ